MPADEEYNSMRQEIRRLHNVCREHQNTIDQLTESGQKLYYDLLHCSIILTLTINDMSAEEIKETPGAAAVQKMVDGYQKSLNNWMITVL